MGKRVRQVVLEVSPDRGLGAAGHRHLPLRDMHLSRGPRMRGCGLGGGPEATALAGTPHSPLLVREQGRMQWGPEGWTRGEEKAAGEGRKRREVGGGSRT